MTPLRKALGAAYPTHHMDPETVALPFARRQSASSRHRSSVCPSRVARGPSRHRGTSMAMMQKRLCNMVQHDAVRRLSASQGGIHGKRQSAHQM